MDKIFLTLRELKELGLPRSSLYYMIKDVGLNTVYETTFRYKGKIYTTDIVKGQIESDMNDLEFECVEVCN